MGDSRSRVCLAAINYSHSVTILTKLRQRVSAESRHRLREIGCDAGEFFAQMFVAVKACRRALHWQTGRA